jgi:hypothetical protein
MARLICSVSLLAFALLLSGCGEPVTHTSLDLSISKLPRATARERQNSLGRIRLAWDFRSDATDDLQRKAELMFVNRYGGRSLAPVGAHRPRARAALPGESGGVRAGTVSRKQCAESGEREAESLELGADG